LKTPVLGSLQCNVGELKSIDVHLKRLKILKMEKEELIIAKNERKVQSRSSRITNFVFGCILTIFVLIVYQFRELVLLTIGTLSMVYGIVGLEFFKTKYSIKVTQDSLEIIKSFRQDIVVDLTKVAYIQLRNSELQVHYSDYVKTYNLPWLTGDDYYELKEKLDEICRD
jgi:hypothetical protein